MGTCCVIQHKQDQGELNEGESVANVAALLSQDANALQKIQQIQRAYRGYKSRGSEKASHKHTGKKNKQERTTGVPDCSPNAVVLEVEKQLGPYRPDNGTGPGPEKQSASR